MASKPPPDTPLAEKAREIKARVLAGETIPLDEVVAFLSTANRVVQGEVKKIEKPTDVDFF
jgi:hypothetical protein